MATKISMDTFERRIDQMKDGMKHLVDAGADKAQSVRSAASTKLDNVGKLIQAHPLAAVGIAFGAGYVAMRILRR